MSGALQLGFSDYEQVYAKKKTRRQIFLEEMEGTQGSLEVKRNSLAETVLASPAVPEDP